MSGYDGPFRPLEPPLDPYSSTPDPILGPCDGQLHTGRHEYRRAIVLGDPPDLTVVYHCIFCLGWVIRRLALQGPE